MTDTELLDAAEAKCPSYYRDPDPIFGLTRDERRAVDAAILAILPVAPAYATTLEIESATVKALGRQLDRSRRHLNQASHAVQCRMALTGLSVMVDPGGWSRPAETESP